MSLPELLFADFEACSLGSASWPIEVGLAWIEKGEVRSASRLIRPDPSWPRDAWSAESQAVHGLTLAELEQAPPAAEVACWTAGLLAGRTLVADAPEHDERWLHRLLATAPDTPRPRVRDFDILVAARLDTAAVLRVYAALDRLAAPHRAGPDAERLARAWRAGLKREG